MAAKRAFGNPVAVGDLASGVLDPLLRRRTGISVALIQSWDEVVGQRLAPLTRPEKIAWPRRPHDDAPFEPATLVVAAEAAAALELQHQTGEVIARVNSFLGFRAIGRIRIVQKPVRQVDRPPRRSPRRLTPTEAAHLTEVVSGIESEGLRKSLAALGAAVVARRRREIKDL